MKKKTKKYVRNVKRIKMSNRNVGAKGLTGTASCDNRILQLFIMYRM